MRAKTAGGDDYDNRYAASSSCATAGSMRSASTSTPPTPPASSEIELRRGYAMIAMVGDQGSDIADGWEERGFKIPTLD